MVQNTIDDSYVSTYSLWESRNLLCTISNPLLKLYYVLNDYPFYPQPRVL